MVLDINRPLRVLLAGALLSLAACGGGDEPVAAKDGADSQRAAEVAAAAAQGGAAIWASCASCHGDQGQGMQSLKAPSLVNQDGWYLKRQLLNFKAGIRGGADGDTQGAQMMAVAQGLPDEAAIDAVVEHIDTLPDVAPQTTVEGEPARGRDHYDMVCGACHGPGGKGNVLLNAPRLAGVDDWYLVAQYGNFGKGYRGTHSDDKYGKQMQMMAGVLPDDTVVDNVIAYIQSRAVEVK
jgi:cytochrome c oxidase subunit 2